MEEEEGTQPQVKEPDVRLGWMEAKKTLNKLARVQGDMTKASRGLWFRMDPLEVVLLLAKVTATLEDAKRIVHGSILLGMERQAGVECLRRPRTMRSLIDVLCRPILSCVPSTHKKKKKQQAQADALRAQDSEMPRRCLCAVAELHATLAQATSVWRSFVLQAVVESLWLPLDGVLPLRVVQEAAQTDKGHVAACWKDVGDMLVKANAVVCAVPDVLPEERDDGRHLLSLFAKHKEHPHYLLLALQLVCLGSVPSGVWPLNKSSTTDVDDMGLPLNLFSSYSGKTWILMEYIAEFASPWASCLVVRLFELASLHIDGHQQAAQVCGELLHALASTSSIPLSNLPEKLLELAMVVVSSRCMPGDSPGSLVGGRGWPEVSSLMHDVWPIFALYAMDNKRPDQVMLRLCELLELSFEDGMLLDTLVCVELPNLLGHVFELDMDVVLLPLLEYAALAQTSPRRSLMVGEVLHLLRQSAGNVLGPFYAIEDTRAIASGSDIDGFVVVRALSDRFQDWMVELANTAVEQVERQRWRVQRFRAAQSQVAALLLQIGTELLRMQVGDLRYLFGNLVCEAFEPINDWKEEADCLQMIEQGLSFSLRALQAGHHWLRVVGQTLPSILRHLQNLPMGRDDKARADLFVALLQLLQDALDRGPSVSLMMIHGLDLVFACAGDPSTTAAAAMMIEGSPHLAGSEVVPSPASPKPLVLPTSKEVRLAYFNTIFTQIHEKVMRMSSQLVRRFVTPRETPLLLHMGIAFAFFIRHYGPRDGRTKIRGLFSALVWRGRRDDARYIHRLCCTELIPSVDERPLDVFPRLRRQLYEYGREDGGLTPKQFAALCDLIARSIHLKYIQEKEENKSKTTLAPPALQWLINKVLIQAADALEQGSFEIVREALAGELSRAELFRTLFMDQLIDFGEEFEPAAVLNAFEGAFPPCIMSNPWTMQQIAVVCDRITHTRRRFGALAKFAREALYELLVGCGAPTLEERVDHLNQWVEEQPQNVTSCQHLVEECGYSPQLWKPCGVSVCLETDGSSDANESFKRALLSCFSGWTALLRELGVRTVAVGGVDVNVNDMFGGEDCQGMGPEELRGRRAAAVRVIDDATRGRDDAYEGLLEKKWALLAKEDALEEEAERLQSSPRQRRMFQGVLHMNFLDTASTSTSSIAGCYAPDGVHCEKPLEIGARANLVVLSVYDHGVRPAKQVMFAQGTEIENVEGILTDQGLYLFRSYSNGHLYDVSEVWIALLRQVVHLVPAIIVPQGFPTSTTFARLHERVPTEVTSAEIVFSDDFFNEGETYYDHRPAKIRAGLDVLLTPSSVHELQEDTSDTVKAVKPRKLQRDLAGTLFSDIMKTMGEDPTLAPFKALGSFLSLYICDLICSGASHRGIAMDGFDVKRWNRSQPKHTLDEDGAKKMVHRLCDFVDEHVWYFLLTVDVEELFKEHLAHFFDLRACLRATVLYPREVQRQLKICQSVLVRKTHIVHVEDLSHHEQESLMRWIFKNEDRVWRYRGGRESHETVQQFLCFLGAARQGTADDGGLRGSTGSSKDAMVIHNTTTYPGVVAYLSDTQGCVGVVCGYAVGEYAPTEEEGQTGYEIVAAWVDPRFRGQGIATTMYLRVMAAVNCSLLFFDILEGTMERVILGSRVLHWMDQAGLRQRVIQVHRASYCVSTGNAGPDGDEHGEPHGEEQFERVVLNLYFLQPSVRFALRMNAVHQWCWAHPWTVGVVGGGVAGFVWWRKK